MSNITLITVFILLLAAGGAVLVWLLDRRMKKILDQSSDDEVLVEWLKSTRGDFERMQDTLSKTNTNITETLQRQFKSQQEQLKSTAEEFSKMQKEMGTFSEIGRTIGQIQEYLQSPKLRGNIGEEMLEEILRQILPNQTFHMQYTFKNGTRVDACIETDSGKLPVDAKFPLTSWREMTDAETDEEAERARRQFVRDVKKHLDTIGEKYLLPDEGTLDMALMYVPSESVYYEIIQDDSLLDYARENRILPVSPTTLYAYLQAVLASFQHRELMERSQEIMAVLQSLENEYAKSERGFEILGKHINNAYNSYSSVDTQLNQLRQKLRRARSLTEGADKPLLDE